VGFSVASFASPVMGLTALVPTLKAQLAFKPRVTELLHGAPDPHPDPGVLVA
jgi:hypothetical protein